ncbi:hypothetical protein AVEN_167185-1 [Araneus ventricosus]|uniref:Uncharacterized protein n=1 Tax=Araneus ventricosus TaxID=182803 RepID=A0A4Y2JB99_ARAVE|nr:hypothetical protein AVEN_167185-1 [Araneus ventricosus]
MPGLVTGQPKLNDNATVFKKELTALLEAVKFAINNPTQNTVLISVDNTSSIQASSNPKSTNTIARDIFKLLHDNTKKRDKWIKAHVGHKDNEKASRSVGKRYHPTWPTLPSAEASEDVSQSKSQKKNFGAAARRVG